MGDQRHAPAALPSGKTWYPLYRRVGGPQGRSGRVRKISPPTGIRSPDRPARSASLYRLSYRGPPNLLQFHDNYHLNWSGIEPDLRGERPSTDRRCPKWYCVTTVIKIILPGCFFHNFSIRGKAKFQIAHVTWKMLDWVNGTNNERSAPWKKCVIKSDCPCDVKNVRLGERNEQWKKRSVEKMCN